MAVFLDEWMVWDGWDTGEGRFAVPFRSRSATNEWTVDHELSLLFCFVDTEHTDRTSDAVASGRIRELSYAVHTTPHQHQ